MSYGQWSPVLPILLPAAPAAQTPQDPLRARLARPEVRDRLQREIATGSPGWWGVAESMNGFLKDSDTT